MSDSEGVGVSDRDISEYLLEVWKSVGEVEPVDDHQLKDPWDMDEEEFQSLERKNMGQVAYVAKKCGYSFEYYRRYVFKLLDRIDERKVDSSLKRYEDMVEKN